MTGIVIRRIDEEREDIGEFIHEAFSRYGEEHGVALNYEDFCYAAEVPGAGIAGVITGRAYYNEVHIGDLIVAAGHRRSGIGSRLVRTVEEAFRGRGYDVITLTTFGFQAPEFYKKLGYTVEFIRRSADPKLDKIFLRKDL
ncbi:MAG: GNAT family N-acetyltransferase [Clostridia bacterium]|nr:GNAT family N-acetyltransferase [Clostridia bacterium]